MKFSSTLSHKHIAQFCESSLTFWGSGRTLEAYIERNLLQQSRSDGLMRFGGMVNDDGELLSSYKRYTLTLSHGEQKSIKALGIGAVFTREVARRQGAASEMLQAALRDAKAEGFGAALLFSDISPDFYERLGFTSYESIDRELTFTKPPSEEPLTLRAFTQEDEAFCYESSLRARSDLSAHLTPSLDEWRFFRWRNAKNPCIILRHNARDVGYLIVEADESSLWIEEWAAPNIPEEVMLSTLYKLAAEHNLSTIRGWLPASKKIEYTETHRAQAIPMLRFFDTPPPESAFFWSIEHF